MKKIQIYLFLGVLVLGFNTSCKKFLDINENPNSPTSGTPELVLPQAIVRTAAMMPNLNNFGSRLMGYQANAGGYSGWGSVVSYNYTTGDYGSIFESTYKANEDFQVVINLSAGSADYGAFIAAAQIMQAYNFQTLVDIYNEIPYSEALKGSDFLQPKYDKGEDVYKALADSLDKAMATLDATTSTTNFVSADPLFKGNITRWLQFANTIKLRLILRSNGKVTFSNTSFNAAGFLKDDALVNPGYAKIDGKQNPMYSSWAYSAAGGSVSVAYIPTPYILAFYNGNKILDEARAKLVFKNGLAVPVNQLGYQGDDAAKGLTPSAWFIGTNATTLARIGILKGPEMGQPIMTASESYFLLAQANLKGITGTPADAEANFNSGILSSFRYLEKDHNGAISAGYNPQADFDKYQLENEDNPLVNFELATTDAEKVEAIVTQEYIANNMINGHQAWFEFLRTGYPRIEGPNTTANRINTFVSISSEASTANKLPNRLLYPASEYKYNDKNIPGNINPFSSKIFWAQ